MVWHDHHVQHICDDLSAEHDALDVIVGGLDPATWARPTPAPAWTIHDQISHLWFFDQRAYTALTDPESFAADRAELLAAGNTDRSVEVGRVLTAEQLLDEWRRARVALLDVARRVDPSTRVPWYGPSMGARSFITARLMETWAHGQDIVDALGASRAPTARLRHVAHIGVGARPFSYATRSLSPSDAAIHVALTAPDGSIWTWGDPAASDRVEGGALDFCLVVTQRRHRDDVRLAISGAAAQEWISIAQAFAGAPGAGREPGQFTGPSSV
jgi:uncharacterized protein (TIGR03084 family)